MSTAKPSVAVVGAGIAGLAAAERLVREKFRVVVVEARNRIGGRIDTRYDFAATPIELGAEFVHGRHPELVRSIRDAGLHLEERRFDPLMLQDGKAIEQPQSWEKVFDELANPEAPDLPIAVRIGELLASGQWTEVEARRLRRFVEGYMAADVNRVSARALSEETRAGRELGDDGNASIREGYDALLRHFASSLEQENAELMLGTAVRRISWEPGSVVLAVDHAREIRASRVVITVPLGFLQISAGEEALVFEPAIPAVLAAARKLAMGNVVKLFFRFRMPLASIPGVDVRLAGRLGASRFLQTPSGAVPTWWRIGAEETPILVGWTGGASADKLSGKPRQEMIDAGVEALSHALAVTSDRIRSAIDACAVVDWSADRWSRGAYSWIPAGALDAPAILATPVAGTLFFAGEATDTSGYRGTVHGALETGLRAARQVMDSF